ncbi:MAG TPA: DUF5691 domain-containing protein, partial [Chloroflexota bacterium]|nr:DUF5691 domain-containing protein [Chloroflexota bacterium]
MTGFADLLDAALAGTVRQDPPAALPVLGQESKESRLLRGASFAGLRHLAGRPFTSPPDAIHVEPAPPETLDQVPEAAGKRLANILDRRPGLLPEYLSLVADHNLRLPHELLPDLLDYAAARLAAHDDLSDLLAATGGLRVAWLAAQRPTWSFAAPFDADRQFERGQLDGRVRALRAIRRRDPERGRTLLEQTWSGENSEARRRLLGSLAVHLSVADEPLLERAVRGRDQGRPAALALLPRLPASNFGRRWAERAQRLLALKDGVLEVAEPDAPPDDWLADGLSPRSPKNTGETAWLLQQVLALTPPSTWSLELLPAIQHSHWAQPLVAGLTDAAIAYADAPWIEALLQAWASSPDVTARAPAHVARLFQQLEPDRAEAFFARLLDV